MAKSIHDTPMLDELENGPWPSFISGIKRLRDKHSDERINGIANDLLGQLEHSYETRKGYWKGGTVSVYGYGTLFACNPPPATSTAPTCCANWETAGRSGGPGW